MEKVSFKNQSGLNLVGDLHKANSDKIIILAHGFTNNRSSQNRFDRLAKSLNKNNFNVFKFDFSGCGESDPAIIELEQEVDDLKAAINYVKQRGNKKIALFGNSLGGLVCLKSYNKQIQTMVLTGPVTDSMKYNWEDIYSKDKMDELDKKGYITLKSEELGTRKVSKKMLDSFNNINQEKLLNDIKCPVLIIHGDQGKEEKELLKSSKKAIKLLNSNSKLEIIQGEKHGLRNNYERVINLTNKWFLDLFN